jgi:shikimate 5-dehydrogenase
MVYGTLEPTRLVRETLASGAVALDGLGMLVAQGALSVDMWRGGGEPRAPRDVMRRAAEAELVFRRAQT